MTFAGQAAIDRLAHETRHADPAESSHWRKYHSAFRFLGDRFEGLQGFGGARPHGVVRGAMHAWLQRRFRNMGRGFPDFPAIDAVARAITQRQRRLYDLDVLRQALTIALLQHTIRPVLSPTTTACVIGDGFASLTSLLLASGSVGRVVLVNLTKTLLVDLWYLKLWLGPREFESSVCLAADAGDLKQWLVDTDPGRQAGAAPKVIAIQAVQHELIRECPIDLALNIASMQEMNPPVVAAYFDDLRAVASSRTLHFYCCNREEKTLPDGTVVRFGEYPWRDDDRVQLDELCPWHQEYYAAGPPFYRPYDGPIRHRLAILSG